MEITGAGSGGGSGGGSLTVTDGVTPVVNVTTLDFTSGATVTSGEAGTANVAISGSAPTFYNDTVSGTINGSNTSFTVPHTVVGAIALFLANSMYQNGVDYSFSGTTITYVTAPDASLAGQPHWFAHT